MALIEAWTAIKQHFAEHWTLGVPIVYENDGFEPPVSPNGEIAPWVYVEVVSTVFAQRSIGASPVVLNKWDESGTMFAHVHVRSGSGIEVAAEIVSAIVELFRGVYVAPGIEFGDMSSDGGPGDDAGNDYVVTIGIDWTIR